MTVRRSVVEEVAENPSRYGGFVDDVVERVSNPKKVKVHGAMA